MRELDLCSEDMVLEEIEMEEDQDLKRMDSGVFRWESFLPRMSLRVLLVEGDDSTRQIVSALLKKCNYTVTAVSDGLKAWEMLKEKPHHVDLILTEVQLPSISGFCLLTMIMGHEICKNIPVIMMSSHDSVSVVFKCMMRGAADFLVKPIRKNELRNLWQHVWRRQTSSGLRHEGQGGNLIQGKFGATSENNAASNPSIDCMASEKGSDSQSSCTKPNMEAESACLNNKQDLLQTKCSSSLAIDTTVHKSEELVKLGGTLLMRESEAEGKSMGLLSAVAPHNQNFNPTVVILEENCAHATLMTGDKVMTPASYKDSDMVNETDDFIEKLVRVETSREAIDLIGTIENQLRCSHRRKDNTTVRGDFTDDVKNLPDKKENMCKFNSAPLLELSLRRFEPSGNQEIVQGHSLNHSNASAFSWYNNRTGQHAFPSPTSFTEPHQCTNNNLKPSSNQGPGNDVDTHQCDRVPQNNIEEDNPPVADPSLQDKIVFSCPQLLPFSGMPLEGVHASYGSLLQPMFYTHQTALPGPPPWSTDSTSLQEPFQVNSSHQFNPKTQNPEKDRYPFHQNASNSGSQSGTTQDNNLESREDPKHILSAPDQSGSNSLCNDSRGHQKGNGCVSVCNGSNKNVSAATSESGNDEGVFTSDQVKLIDCQRVSQREAALNKFRLKRKDRCFEKKVRYQSRKRLAEQRPRVKGQFVRRVQSCQMEGEEEDFKN